MENPVENGLPVIKNSSIKSVIYFGSASLHWYDPSSYLTYLNSNIDAIICNSQFVYEHVKNQLFGKRKEKVVRIYKGYNPDWFVNHPPKRFKHIEEFQKMRLWSVW